MYAGHQPKEEVHGGGGVLAVAIGADFVGEHLADGCPADGHLDLGEAGGPETIDHRFHVSHGGGQQGAHPNDIGFALFGGGHEFVDALVHADIMHFEAGAFGHHADQVLADVVEVAAHGAHQQGPDALDALAGAEEGFEHGHAGLHRAGGDEHLGDVENVVLEIFSHHAHAGDQALVQIQTGHHGHV